MTVDHDAWVNTVAFSPDGRKLATASGDKAADLGRHQRAADPRHHPPGAATSGGVQPERPLARNRRRKGNGVALRCHHRARTPPGLSRGHCDCRGVHSGRHPTGYRQQRQNGTDSGSGGVDEVQLSCNTHCAPRAIRRSLIGGHHGHQLVRLAVPRRYVGRDRREDREVPVLTYGLAPTTSWSRLPMRSAPAGVGTDVSLASPKRAIPT
jgi:hypothetical protein